MQRIRALAVCAPALWLAAGAPASGEEPEPARAAPPPREAPAAAAHPRVWWNDPKVVEQLALDDAQRAKMDGYLEAYRRGERPEDRRTPYHAALRDGDWAAARDELKRLADATAAAIRARGELKIGVLSALSGEQREALVAHYPPLIGQPWINAMRLPARGGREAGGT